MLQKVVQVSARQLQQTHACWGQVHTDRLQNAVWQV